MPIKIEASEKDIEDILCQNIKRYLGLRFVDRQVSTPAGTIDILAAAGNGIFYVIELKKGPLDPFAYAQVMRYCHYLNSNNSGNGKRTFSPLLIGEQLSNEMIKCVRHFELDEDPLYNTLCNIPEYTLYNFDPLNGISFSYYRPDQKEYEENNFFNEITYLERIIQKHRCQNYILAKELLDLKNAEGQDERSLV